MIAFQNHAIMKHKIYKNILARINGIYYSPGIRFETSLIKMDETKAFTDSNQLEKFNQKQQIWCQCGSINHLHITTKD